MQNREDFQVLEVVQVEERKGRGVILRRRRDTTASPVPTEANPALPQEQAKENTKTAAATEELLNTQTTTHPSGEEAKGIPAGTPLYLSRPDIYVLYSFFARTHCYRCFHLVPRNATEDKEKEKEEVKWNTCEKSPAMTPKEAEDPSNTTTTTTDPSSTSSPPLPSSDETGTASYTCSTCDQFVLCASCVQQLISEVVTSGRAPVKGEGEEESVVLPPPPSSMHPDAILQQHSMLRLHQTSCEWYNELPAEVRAPGKDTDYLRFCLLYGAMTLHAAKEAEKEEPRATTIEEAVGHGDVVSTMHGHPHHRSLRDCLACLGTLEDNRSSQDIAVMEFCHSFATDKIVAFFGPKPTTESSAAASASSVPHVGKDTDPTREGRSAGAVVKDGAPPSYVTPRYPVSGEHLARLLLQVRCNSLGFPFTTEETIGWALEGLACMLNHSCVPNAAVVVADQDEDFRSLSTSSSNGESGLKGCFGIKSIRPIAEGEEVTISYLDVEAYENAVDERTRTLLETFRFLCTCPKCLQQRAERKAKKGS